MNKQQHIEILHNLSSNLEKVRDLWPSVSAVMDSLLSGGRVSQPSDRQPAEPETKRPKRAPLTQSERKQIMRQIRAGEPAAKIAEQHKLRTVSSIYQIKAAMRKGQAS